MIVINVVDVIVVDEHKYCFCVYETVPTPLSAPSKAFVCDHSLAGNVGSNPAEGMDISLL